MSNIQLFIAATLDGFIARPDGSIDWLEKMPDPDDNEFDYSAFIAGVDTVVMGRSTYETVLGFDVEWPYAAQQTWVVTTQTDLPTPTPNTGLIHQVDADTIRQLRAASKKNIWLVGGGEVIRAFMALDSVDELMVSLIPVTIGEGIPLFPQVKETNWKLLSVTPWKSGLVYLHYRRM